MGQLTAWKYIKDQFATLPLVSGDLTGKTVLVVGANAGIGLEAARHFARMNPRRLIVACRSMGKAESAVKSVQDTTGCQTLEPWNIDLENFNSVRAFADRYERDGGGRLDLLVMNAAVLTYKFKKTGDEWETALQVNHISTSLLTLLLLPYLQKAPASPPTPRIVIVTSEAHYFLPPLDEAQSSNILEQLNNGDHYAEAVQSVLRPLLGLPATHAILKYPQSDSDFCESRLTIGDNFQGCIVYFFGFILARSSEVGSRAVVWASLAGEDGGAEVHGRYTATCRVEEESDYALSIEGTEVEVRIWKETLEVLRKIDPRVDDIVKKHLERS